MNKLQKTMVWIAVSLFSVMLLVGLGGNFVVDKIADKVIEKLEKPYGPSPYGPGFDPDRINVNAFNRSENWEEE
jgi:hypothetical protein